MSTAIDPALLSRISGEFDALGSRMWALGRDLETLGRQVGAQGALPTPLRSVSAENTAPAHRDRAASPPGNSADASTADGPDAVAGTDLRSAPKAARSAATSDTPAAGDQHLNPGSASAGAQDAPGATARTDKQVRGADDASAAPSNAHLPQSAGSAASSAPYASDAADLSGGPVSESGQAGLGASGASDLSGEPAAGSGQAGLGASPTYGMGGDRIVQGGSGAQYVPSGYTAPTVPGNSPAASQQPGVPAGPPVPPWPAPPWPAPNQGRAAFVPQPPYGQPVAFAPGWMSQPVAPQPYRGAVGQQWPRPPQQAQIPWWQRDGVISKLLAISGVAVTLIGVVMLLVLAAQAGFFGPVPRVVAGAAFSLTMVGAGLRTFGRAGGRIGAIALAATGFAGLYLDVVAVSATYHWLHPLIGFAAAFGVAAAGVALALRWNSQPLAVLVVLGAAILAPVLTTEIGLLGCLIALQLACIPVHSVRDWSYVQLARTLPAVLAAMAFIAGAAIDGGTISGRGDRGLLLLATAIIATVGLVGTVYTVRVRPNDVAASVILGIAVVPLLLAIGLYSGERPLLVAAALATAAVLLLLAVAGSVPVLRDIARLPAHTTVVAAVAGACAVLEACLGATGSRTLPVAFLIVAVAYLAVAGQRRSHLVAWTGAVFTVLGGLTLLVHAGPSVLSTERLSEENLGVATLFAAMLGLCVVAVGIWCTGRLAKPSPTTKAGANTGWWAVGSLCGLYAVTVATVSVGVACGAHDGFRIGHSAATILWMAAATAALFYGLRHLAGADPIAKFTVISGLSVTAAALVKLFLFDLATLDGLLRVAAFLVVGVLLLVVGTRYARAFAEAGRRRTEQEGVAPM